MELAKRPLPQDPSELRIFAEALVAELYAKNLHIEKLKAQLAALRRARFGRSSEKLDREIDQLELLIGEIEQGDDTTSDVPAIMVSAQIGATPRREPARPARGSLPDHLPRERVVHDAPCVCKECGGTTFSVIGTDEREVLELVPSHFKVIVHARPKLSCRTCETIMQAPVPSLPIDRGLPGPGLLAHVLVSKYADHIPLHRQSGIYAREGVSLERSTMADWVRHMTFLLRPVHDEIRDYVRSGESLHADDTPVPVLDPGRGQTKTGRLWIAVRDERPWGSAAPPAVFYRYAPDRKAEQAGALLEGCRGYLHADAYAGFRHLYIPDPITGEARLNEVGCWAHARRKLYEVYKDTDSPRAQELLQSIGQLFAIEAEIRGHPPEERKAVRQEHAMPLLNALHARLVETLGQVGRKSDMADAIAYITSRWIAMTRYTTDGRLEISNNAAERGMRPVAIGRNNWTFAGSDGGGERAAMMYTLIETAKINGLDPDVYLREIICRISDFSAKSVTDLLPWNIVLDSSRADA